MLSIHSIISFILPLQPGTAHKSTDHSTDRTWHSFHRYLIVLHFIPSTIIRTMPHFNSWSIHILDQNCDPHSVRCPKSSLDDSAKASML
jgi:hypothetical protein